MAEYIERERARHELTLFFRYDTDVAEDCDSLLCMLPAADVVPVVRCKDCIHGELDDPELVFAYYCKHDRCSWNKADHFCAYGERRDTDD